MEKLFVILSFFLIVNSSFADFKEIFNGYAYFSKGLKNISCTPFYGYNEPLLYFDRSSNLIESIYLDYRQTRFTLLAEDGSFLKLVRSYKCSLDADWLAPPKYRQFSSSRADYYFYSPDNSKFDLYLLNIEKLKAKPVKFIIYSPRGEKIEIDLPEVKKPKGLKSYSAPILEDSKYYPRKLTLSSAGVWRVSVLPTKKAKYGIWLEKIPNFLSSRPRKDIPFLADIHVSFSVTNKTKKTIFGVVGSRGKKDSMSDLLFKNLGIKADKVYVYPYKLKLLELVRPREDISTLVVLAKKDYAYEILNYLSSLSRKKLLIQYLNQPNLEMSSKEYSSLFCPVAQYAKRLNLKIINGSLGTDESSTLINYGYIEEIIKACPKSIYGLSFNMYRIHDPDQTFLIKEAVKRLQSFNPNYKIIIGEFNRYGGLQNPGLFEDDESVIYLANMMIDIADSQVEAAYYFRLIDKGYRKKGLFKENLEPKKTLPVFLEFSKAFYEGAEILRTNNSSLKGFYFDRKYYLVNSSKQKMIIENSFKLRRCLFGLSRDNYLYPMSVCIYEKLSE